jgi:membrane protein implicated in regulation of membrane protease activity
MILDISSWWQALENFEKIYWIIALLFSALFVTQIILSFAGGDSDAMGDSDAFIEDDAGIGSQYFTFKNLVAFLTMFGWMGIAGTQAGWSQPIVVIVALLAGIALVGVMAYIFSRMLGLQQSGTMQITNAINKMGTTYLFIPGDRKGTGKVQLSVQGSVHELQAITDDTADIPTGKPVKVTGVIGTDLLVVTAKI